MPSFPYTSVLKLFYVLQDEFSADLYLNDINIDFLDNVLLDNGAVTTVNNTDFGHLNCATTDAHRTDHIYSQSYRDSASEGQHEPSVSPPSVGSHASLYSYSTGSPLADVSSSGSPTEVCSSPLDSTMEVEESHVNNMTVQGMLTVGKPTSVMLQGDNVIHVVTGYDETVTDDSGLISVGRCQRCCL